jgi:hypothetical protein
VSKLLTADSFVINWLVINWLVDDSLGADAMPMPCPCPSHALPMPMVWTPYADWIFTVVSTTSILVVVWLVLRPRP